MVQSPHSQEPSCAAACSDLNPQLVPTRVGAPKLLAAITFKGHALWGSKSFSINAVNLYLCHQPTLRSLSHRQV